MGCISGSCREKSVSFRFRQGFSLFELAIGLTAMGLVAGLVLVGQDLISSGRINKIGVEEQTYQTAIRAFKTKYFYLPGDMPNATLFWGKDNAHCSAQTGTASAKGTCNGDGDGTINTPVSAGATEEYTQMWKQLALSGLITGTFSGITGALGQWDLTPGVNIPKSVLPNTGWSGFSGGTYPGDTDVYVTDFGNFFEFGAAVPNGRTAGAALTPQQAFELDTKYDDGSPGRGKITALYWNNACAAADDGNNTKTNTAAHYRVYDSSIQCALFFTHAY